MATYVQHRLRAFRSSGDPSELPSNRSAIFRLKSYNSATDPRAWATSNTDRKQYILDVFTSDHTPDALPSRYVNGQALLETLLHNKDADIECLQEQLFLTDRFLDDLGITSEQREFLHNKRMQVGRKEIEHPAPSSTMMKGDTGNPSDSSAGESTVVSQSNWNLKSLADSHQGFVNFACSAMQKMHACHATIGYHFRQGLRRTEYSKEHKLTTGSQLAVKRAQQRGVRDVLRRRKPRILSLHSYHNLSAILPMKPQHKIQRLQNSCSQTEFPEVTMKAGDNSKLLSALLDQIREEYKEVDFPKLGERLVTDKSMQYMQDTLKSICAQTSENRLHPVPQQLRIECDIKQLECDRYKLHIAELVMLSKEYERLKETHAQLQQESRQQETKQQKRIGELEENCAALQSQLSFSRKRQVEYTVMQKQVERLENLVTSQRKQIKDMEQSSPRGPQVSSTYRHILEKALDEKTMQLRIMEDKIFTADLEYKEKINMHVVEMEALQSTLNDFRAQIQGLEEQNRELLIEKGQLCDQINDNGIKIARLEEDNKFLRGRENRVKALRAKVLEIQRDNERCYQMYDKIKDHLRQVPEVADKESQYIEDDTNEHCASKQLECIHKAIFQLECDLQSATLAMGEDETTLGILQSKYGEIQRIAKEQMRIFSRSLHRCRVLLRSLENKGLNVT